MTGFEPLTDFEADYEVEIDEPHRIRRIGSDKFVSTWLHHSGYYYIALNGRSYQLHRILAKHFVANPENLPEIDHIDRDKTNNSIDNLRWSSRSDNMRNIVHDKTISGVQNRLGVNSKFVFHFSCLVLVPSRPYQRMNNIFE